ncbi:MAG: SH3 domain-containing protein, partial [Chloroflexota bacterium]|nr:SH3 domain-containing protein [Chloroflexota bacterium]
MYLLNPTQPIVQPLMRQAAPTQPPFLSPSLRFVLLGLLLIAGLAGCIAPAGGSASAQAATPSAPDTFNGAVADIAGYALPTSVPTATVTATTTATATLSVVVNTDGARANLRSSPGTNAPIVGKANNGTALKVVGKNANGTWWQICCVKSPTDNANQTTATAWIAASVVRTAGAGEVATVASVAGDNEPLLRPDFKAQWQVDWTCGSERCQVKECAAVVDAKVGRSATQPFLAIENQVTWNDTCFATDSWVFEVNPATGQERTGEYADNFLYGYWRGSQPGQPNGVYTLQGGKAAAVWCSGPHTVELEEGDGWTTVYEGNTCHD